MLNDSTDYGAKRLLLYGDEQMEVQHMMNVFI